MRKLLATLMVCGTLANPVLAQAPSNPEAAAQKLLDLLDQGKFAEAEASFAPAMAQAVPEARLRQVWQSLPASAGTPKGRGKASQTRQDGMTKVSVPLHYANAELVAHVTFDANGKVAGLLIQPASTPAAAVAADAAYGERELMLGQGAEALPATLAMPKARARFRRWCWFTARDHRIATKPSARTARSWISRVGWRNRASQYCVTTSARAPIPGNLPAVISPSTRKPPTMPLLQ